MRIRYFADTDTLYLDLVERQSESTLEINEDCYIDVDGDTNVVGVLIEHASRHADLERVISEGLPVESAAGKVRRTKAV